MLSCNRGDFKKKANQILMESKTTQTSFRFFNVRKAMPSETNRLKRNIFGRLYFKSIFLSLKKRMYSIPIQRKKK